MTAGFALLEGPSTQSTGYAYSMACEERKSIRLCCRGEIENRKHRHASRVTRRSPVNSTEATSMPPSTDLPEIPDASAPSDMVSKETLRFDYPGSDIILRSSDSHDFRVPKLYLVNSSPVLRKLIRTVSNASRLTSADDEEKESFLVVKLPESGAIIHSLLTFIFPVAPLLPSTTENIMRLLAVAQKYRMDSVLTHIRGVIALQDPPLILPETALYIYFLAQKHELHKEALRAARSTLQLSMIIEDMEDKVNFMPGAYLRELWEYHERVRMDLASSLLEFRNSGAPDIVKDLRCGNLPSTPPIWLDDYIESLARSLHLFDLIEFENALANHIKEQRSATCPCVGLSSQTIRAFWVALTTVVHGTIERVRVRVTRTKFYLYHDLTNMTGRFDSGSREGRTDLRKLGSPIFPIVFGFT